MSSFFIRKPGDKAKKNLKRKGPKPKVHYDKKDKKSKTRGPSKTSQDFDDEEISSDDEEVDLKNVGRESPDEDELLSAQEKKLKLAKKYLEEIKEDLRRSSDEEEVSKDDVLGRLKEDVLSQAGKLKVKIADELNSDISENDYKILKCKDHKLSVTCVIISSDSKFIYSGSKEGSIVKWGIDGKRLKIIPPRFKHKENENLHSSVILSIAISVDNKYLASSDDSSLIRIWNPDNLEHICNFKGHRAAVTGLSFCKFSDNLYSCSRDKTVKVWSMPERAYIETLFGHQTPVTSIDVLCKGRVVTSGGADNTCRIWKIEEETQLVYNGNSRNIDSVKRLDDNHFVSCDDNGSISLWGTLKKKPLCVFRNAHGTNSITSEGYWISSIACISNSEVFASGSNDGFVRFWSCAKNYRSFEELFKIPLEGFVNSMVFSSDHKYLILGVGQEHRLGRWERINKAKNSVVIVNLTRKSSELVNGTDVSS